MIEALIERTEQLEEQYTQLEAEQRRIGDALGLAINADDEAALDGLQQRRAELPGLILKAKLSYWRAMQELAEARHQADKDRLAEINEITAPVVAQIQALQEQIGPLLYEGNQIAGREGQHRDRRNNAKRKIELLQAERADMLTKLTVGPPVRSLWHGRTS